jgi:hypothetical protein
MGPDHPELAAQEDAINSELQALHVKLSQV